MKNLPLLLQQFSVIVLLINGLVLQHHQVAANSSARLVLRLISYENLANLRISGASCDSMRSPCDPSFDVTAIWGGPDIRVTSPCLSNEERVYFPDEVSRLPELAKPIKSRDGPMPSWAEVRISISDCLYSSPTDLIARFQLNITIPIAEFIPTKTTTTVAMDTNSSLSVNQDIGSFSKGQLVLHPSSMKGNPAVLSMQPIHSPESIRMRISVWIECSPGFYGRGCDVRCEPQRGCCCDSEGLLRCDETIDCSAQLATKPAFPTSGPGGAGSSNGNSDNRNRDEATSVLFIAVMASSMTSIFILAVIALVAIKMCKASESNALIISRLVSQDASVSSVDADSTVLNLRRQQNHYQLQHQNLGYFNPASYNTLTSQVTNLSTIVSTSAVPANNRTDSGVYEDPQEPPAGDPSETPPPPPPPPRPLQSRQSEDIQRMPQSKSYSRKAAAKE
ncbi:hypothetical protein BOX15_Mlig009932g1 [Macrostomum lignano]|uniref:DSL domain-containing protein n=1 Tax=Macrostomum lignano TaxID=282301 RepID=A0A267ESK2_9PLAT|nr:hypothetical protein BOX15_Mlig009932g1 [Macrostomum lignano]